MKKAFTILFSILCIISLQAQVVTFKEASVVAETFFSNKHKSLVECSFKAKEGQNVLFYIFNSKDSYVVVSGEKSCPPILAYSDKTLFNEENIIAPVNMWLDYYKQQIIYAKETNSLPSEDIQSEWNQLLNNKSTKIVESVEPFLLSKWGQEDNYNFYCPKDDKGPNGHTVTGCVATAMAQLIYYFRFPNTGLGSYTYEDENYGTISANFGETTYDFSAMPDAANGINLPASLLSHHCGVAVDMVYGPNGSGMYNHKAAYALRNYFKYSPQTEYCYRDSTDLNWDSLMLNHLNRRIPLYYAGWSVPNIMGHAFICDGYDKTDNGYYYHFNFGWEGSYDGYFYTEDLVVGGNIFTLAQELIINAYPDTVNYTYPNPVISGTTILKNNSGSFEDGSGRCNDYINNVDYTWIIQPDYDSIKNIQLTVNYDIAEYDTIFITYDNGSIEPQTITNETASYSITYQGKSIIVRFKTNNTITKDGFSASYVSILPNYCRGKVYSDPSGTIGDGSGDFSYNNFTNCSFMIYSKDAMTIDIDFTKFETESDKDILYIYDRANDNVLLETLSGSLQQTHYSFNTSVLAFTFVTDELNTFDGWEFNYNSLLEGIDNTEQQLNNIEIYPNPSSDFIHISSCDLMIYTAKIIDMSGKLVKIVDINSLDKEINISELQRGTYLIEINTKVGTITKKLVIS